MCGSRGIDRAQMGVQLVDIAQESTLTTVDLIAPRLALPRGRLSNQQKILLRKKGSGEIGTRG